MPRNLAQSQRLARALLMMAVEDVYAFLTDQTDGLESWPRLVVGYAFVFT